MCDLLEKKFRDITDGILDLFKDMIRESDENGFTKIGEKMINFLVLFYFNVETEELIKRFSKSHEIWDDIRTRNISKLKTLVLEIINSSSNFLLKTQCLEFYKILDIEYTSTTGNIKK